MRLPLPAANIGLAYLYIGPENTDWTVMSVYHFDSENEMNFFVSDQVRPDRYRIPAFGCKNHKLFCARHSTQRNV